MRRGTRTIAIAAVVVLVGGGTALAIGVRSSPPTVPRSRSHPSASTAAARTTQGVAITGAPTPDHVSTVQDVICSGATCVAVGSSPSGDPLMWWSSDGGATFQPSEATIPADVTLNGVTCQEQTCVATGLASAPPPRGRRWRSPRPMGALLHTHHAARGRGRGRARLLALPLRARRATARDGRRGVSPRRVASPRTLDAALPVVRPCRITHSTDHEHPAVERPRRLCRGRPLPRRQRGHHDHGPSYVPTVWTLTGPRSARVVVATPSAPLGGGGLWSGITTCAILAPRSGTTYSLVVATTRASTRDVVTDPSGSASSDQDPFLDPRVLTCINRSCIIASPSKFAPAALWAERDGRLTRLPNSLPAWIQLGLSGTAEPSRGTLLVPAPAHDGSMDATLLRLSVSPTGVTPKGFVTLPPS